MSKSEFLKVNLQAISKRAFASALEKAKNESQTKSKSENDESQVLIEFNNEHPGFAHTTVTKKLLPILISRLMTKMYEKISQEKVVKMLDTEPYKSAGVDKIFRDDNLRLQLEKDCELNEDDQKEAVIRAREKTKTKKWTDKLINLADILSDPDKFYVAFFKDEPPLLRKMAKREIKEESDISMAMSKYKDSKILTFKLLITTLRDYDYDKLDLFMKIKFKFAAKLTNWGMNHAGLQIGPYIIDWNDSSLILPRYLSSKHAKALIPINDKVTPTKDQACPTICRLICQWNREFTYENCISFKPETKKGNCQHFVQQILDALGIKNNWKPWGPVDKYISKIAEGTMGKDIIISDPDAQEIFINSHEELRQFYKNIMENPKVKGDRVLMDEYLALLKSVERSFQLRHMGNPEVFPEIKDPIFGDFTGKLSAK